MMILIAPDKFKGTLTSREAASIIANALRPAFCYMVPMADGGEGTASVIGANYQWQPRNGYYVNPDNRIAVLDSSAFIGLTPNNDVMHRTSAALGVKVREIIKGGCDKVIIGVGGTGTCDGGVGFLQALDKYSLYKDKIIGLCDVEVPLLPPSGIPNAIEPSALMFALQKGATADDLGLLYQQLEQAQNDYGHGRTSEFDGAGGGLGFAIASAIGAKCYLGAEYIFDKMKIDWNQVSFVVTGEGCVDAQTLRGKVVDVVCRKAHEHGKPVFLIGGKIEQPHPLADLNISCCDYHPEWPLNKETAAKRLEAAAVEIKKYLLSFLG